jgi:hypothetical protein
MSFKVSHNAWRDTSKPQTNQPSDRDRGSPSMTVHRNRHTAAGLATWNGTGSGLCLTALDLACASRHWIWPVPRPTVSARPAAAAAPPTPAVPAPTPASATGAAPAGLRSCFSCASSRSCSSCTPSGALSSSSRCSLSECTPRACSHLQHPRQHKRAGGGLPGSTTAAATCLHLHLRRRLLPP